MRIAQAKRGVRNGISAAAQRNDQHFLGAKILPELRELDLNEIMFDTLERFVGKIGVDLSPSFIQRRLSLICKVLDYALKRNLLRALPKLSKIRKQDAPRGSLPPAEYELLLERAKAMVGTEHAIRVNAKSGRKQGNVVMTCPPLRQGQFGSSKVAYKQAPERQERPMLLCACQQTRPATANSMRWAVWLHCSPAAMLQSQHAPAPVI